MNKTLPPLKVFQTKNEKKAFPEEIRIEKWKKNFKITKLRYQAIADRDQKERLD